MWQSFVVVVMEESESGMSFEDLSMWTTSWSLGRKDKTCLLHARNVDHEKGAEVKTGSVVASSAVNNPCRRSHQPTPVTCFESTALCSCRHISRYSTNPLLSNDALVLAFPS